MKWIVVFILASCSLVYSQPKKTFELVSKMDGIHFLDNNDTTNIWGYSFYNSEGTPKPKLPSPTLVVNEGDSVHIIMYNTSGEGHTIHMHGLDADQANDGVPHLSYFVSPHVDTGNYRFVAKHAGNYMYHCHVTSTLHVTMGMYGVFIVKAQGGVNQVYTGGPTYTKEYIYFSSDMQKSWNDDYMSIGPFNKYKPDRFLINGIEKNQLFQDSSQVIQAQAGDTVLLRLINLGYSAVKYEFPSQLNATFFTNDGRILNPTEKSDTLTLFPGERTSALLYFNSSYSGYIKVHYHSLYQMKGIGFNEIGINLFSPSSINEQIISTNNFKVFPNPTSGIININFQIDGNEKINIEAVLFDVSGKLVKTDRLFHQKESLDYSNLTKGVYILKLTGRNFSETLKIIKN